jgi:hypothetical protein
MLVDYMPGPGRTYQLDDVLPAFTGSLFSAWRLNNRSAPRDPIRFAEEMIAVLRNDDAPLKRHVAPKFANEWKYELREVREEFAALLDRYLIAAQARRHEMMKLAFGVSASQSRAMIGIYADWIEITAADFSPHENENERKKAVRAFLRGARGTPCWVSKLVVQRIDTVGRLAAAAQDTHLLLLHGPFGEGKTIVLWQLASEWLEQGRRVFALRTAEALRDSEFTAALRWHERPLVIVDDIPLSAPPPSWVVPIAGRPGGCIAVGLQTRNLAACLQMTQAAKPRDIRVSAVRPEDAPAYIDLIEQYAAAPTSVERPTIERLFVNGLRMGLGGLWPAMWQATRGAKLDDRVREFVDSVRAERSLLRVLGAVTFVNYHCEPRCVGENLSQPMEPRRSLIAGLIRNLNLRDAAIAQDLKRLESVGEAIEGELLGTRLDDLADPTLRFRHPAVTASMYRWIFGISRDGIGHTYVEIWPYYFALARALPKSGETADNVLRLIRSYEIGWEQQSPAWRELMAEASWEGIKGMAELALATHPSLRTTDRVLIALAEAAIRSSAPGEERFAYGISRLEAATADPKCPVDVLVAASRILQDHSIVLPAAVGSEERDWQYFSHRTLERQKGRKSPALNMVYRIAGQVPINGEDLAKWLNRSALSPGRVSPSFLNVIADVSDYFCTQGSGSDFANGPADEALRSLRSLWRFFWQSCALRPRWIDLISKSAGAPEALRLAGTCRRILDAWAQFDAKNDDLWPAGVMEDVRRIHDQQTQWAPFMRSYPDYYPVDQNGPAPGA